MWIKYNNGVFTIKLFEFGQPHEFTPVTGNVNKHLRELRRVMASLNNSSSPLAFDATNDIITTECVDDSESDDEIPDLVDDPELVESNDYDYCNRVRKELSVENVTNEDIQTVIDNGILDRLVKILTTSSIPKTQLAALWAISNVASGNKEQSTTVLKTGIVPTVVSFMGSANKEIRSQATWLLSNLLGDLKGEEKNQVTKTLGFWPSLFCNMTSDDEELLETSSWCFSNAFNNFTPTCYITQALNIIRNVLDNQDCYDDKVVVNLLWGLSYLTNNCNDEIIDMVLNTRGLLHHISGLMDHKPTQIVCIRLIGNFVSGNDDEQTDFVLSANVVKSLVKCLDSKRTQIRREACWTLSNIAAGTQTQLDHLLDAGVIEIISDLIEEETDNGVLKEALYVIYNAIEKGNNEQLTHIVDNGVLDILVDNMEQYPKMMLETVSRLLNFDQDCVNLMYETDGVSAIEKQLENENTEVRELAQTILSTYF